MPRRSLCTLVLTLPIQFSCRGHSPSGTPVLPRAHELEAPVANSAREVGKTSPTVDSAPKNSEPSENNQTLSSSESEIDRVSTRPAPSTIVITADDRSRRLEAGTGVNNGIFGPLSWLYASCEGPDGLTFSLYRSPAVQTGHGTLSKNSQTMTLICQSPSDEEKAWICTSKVDATLELSLLPLSKEKASSKIKQGEISADLPCDLKAE